MEFLTILERMLGSRRAVIEFLEAGFVRQHAKPHTLLKFLFDLFEADYKDRKQGWLAMQEYFAEVEDKEWMARWLLDNHTGFPERTGKLLQAVLRNANPNTRSILNNHYARLESILEAALTGRGGELGVQFGRPAI